MMLKTGEPRSLSPLDGEVVLVSGEVDIVVRPDGRMAERGHGLLRFVRGAESTELAFDEGTAFEMWGHKMAVFGPAGDFELSVFPPGEPVSP